MCSLFHKKDIEECLHLNTCNQKLKRSLGPIGLIIMGIGAIVGAGIFIVTGVASVTSGPALILSFVIAGMACGLTALCYAEMASMITVAGGIYTYTHVTMGEIWAWMIGWTGILQYIIAASAVAIGWSSYTSGFFSSMGFSLPEIITSSPLNGSGLINLPALLIVALLTGILVLGAKESAKVNAVIVIIKLAVIGLFIVIGAQFINPVNYHPFAPNGLAGVLQGAAMVFFAYVGFDTVASAAEETKNPQKALPIGIIGSLAVCSLLYIIVTAIITGMVPYTTFEGNAAPVQLALQSVGINWATAVVTVGAIAGLTTVILVSMFVVPRLLFAMSRDQLLPKRLTKVHPNFKSPITSIILVGVISSLISAFLPLEGIFELVNISALTAFIFLALSVIILRKQRPDIKRKFKCPLVPAIPIISIIACLGLITQLKLLTIEVFGAWLLAGLTFYFIFRRYKKYATNKDSNLLKKEIHTVTKEISAK
ncbi:MULTISPECIES: amino acid permease [Methanobacterium]|jgi:APA family basic amino acid/polyamine antiporter|uniref:Amino acid permease n=1 Tax=Methanobacterium veterum TaxID=408577 RepID=A0A9E5A5X6_9EURY|nr:MULTISPECIES: amino acid permease [Methanobacterium]MCZ3364432.1 amino acid permease [Methanobacterium veterum]MCZ3372183.1 amino acid permease [Methanobacterium veterum]